MNIIQGREKMRNGARHGFRMAEVYPPGFDLLPERWRESIETAVRGILPTMPEPYALHDVNHFDED